LFFVSERTGKYEVEEKSAKLRREEAESVRVWIVASFSALIEQTGNVNKERRARKDRQLQIESERKKQKIVVNERQTHGGGQSYSLGEDGTYISVLFLVLQIE
jgi:hypothetical protein